MLPRYPMPCPFVFEFSVRVINIEAGRQGKKVRTRVQESLKGVGSVNRWLRWGRPMAWGQTYGKNKHSRALLVLHLIIVRLLEVVVVVLIFLVAELLSSLGKVNVFAARAPTNNVVCVDLGHGVVFQVCALVSTDSP